ncbi:MAG: ABC transporter substrate-binding protein [Actinomycetota bacterium]|nr:ABC transporter substrate-binding protein [Actinomycetota bacterium]
MAQKNSMQISRRDFLKMSGAGLTGAVLLGVAGCGGGGEIQGGQGGGGGGGNNIFTFGQGSDPLTLDPIHITDSESSKVARQMFDSLLGFAPESTDVVPALATEVPEAENGGLSYTFNLREGVKFHDGEPFNAEAVVFNFERWKNTKNPYHAGGGSQSGNFSYFQNYFGGFDAESNIEKIEAVDDYTVRFTLREPQGPFLDNIAQSNFGMASPKAIKEDVEKFWQNPVGTGPFKFVSWNKGTEVNLEQNSDWWGGEAPESQGGGGPHVKKVVVRGIPDNTSRTAALTGGELTAADGLTPDDIPTVEQASNLKITYRPPLTIGYMAMNVQKEPFDQREVRQAVNMAINMPEIVEAFFGETGEVATTYIPPTVSFFDDSIEHYPYDPERARQMLQQAGVQNLSVDFWYMPIPRPYMPDGKGIAQAMQQDLKEVGINAKLMTRDWGTYIEETGRGVHDMCLLGWSGDNGDPSTFLDSLLKSSAATEEDALNVAYYKNQEVDDLLNQALSTTDQDERRTLYLRAQQILVEDAPWVPIAYVKPPVGLQNSVQGFHPNPTGGEAWNSVRLGGGGGA